jgi:hypothetical protein
LIPTASVVTRKSLGEFLLLKKSLETYHEVKWYVSSDEFSHEKLSEFHNVKSLPIVKTDDCSHGTDDPVKNRLFLELVMTKFDALRAAMNDNGWGLFVDSDIFFTAPIEDRVLSLMRDPGVDAVLSPHMTNNLTLETQVGHYNVGFFSVRNRSYLENHAQMSWKHKELGMYYEQQPLQFCSYPYLTVNLPINYNIGWWRFNEPHTRGRLDLLGHNEKSLIFGGLPAVCFHVHTLKKLDYTNYGQFLVDRVKTLMRQCKNTGYEELIQIMDEKDDGT